MAEHRCPICKGPAKPRPENPYFPFCSNRCRLVDLGNWFGGSYRVPQRYVEEGEAVLADEEEE